MSAQSWEDQAFLALSLGNKNEAIRCLRHGATISLGRGRSARMEDWADALEDNVNGFEYKEGDTSFSQMEARYWREKS